MISLIYNLISSSDSDPSHQQNTWIEEYNHGCGHEIYLIYLPEVFENLTFSQVASFVYNKFGCVLFALEININNKNQIILNPSKMKLTDIKQNEINGFIISTDKKVADKVSSLTFLPENFEMNIDKSFSYLESHLFEKQKLISKTSLKKIDDYHKKRTFKKKKYFQIKENKEKNLLNDSNEVSLENNKFVRFPLEKNISSSESSSDEMNSQSDEYSENFMDYYYSNSNEIQNLKNYENSHHSLENHILICEEFQGIDIFIKSLRKKYLQQVIPIVILSTKRIPITLKNKIEKFPQIYYLCGDPLNKDDLKRCHIKTASKAIIYSSLDQEKNDEIISKDEKTILIYNSLISMNKHLEIFMEVIHPESIKLLNDYSNFFVTNRNNKKVQLNSKQKQDKGLFLTKNEICFSHKELIAAGRISLTEIMDRLTAQSYYNPQIINLVNLLLNSEDCLNYQFDEVTRSVLFELRIEENFLIQKDIPKQFINKSYKELFLHLINQENTIALGLYRYNILIPRISRNKGNYLPFTYVNPLPETKLNSSDKIFVLMSKMNYKIQPSSSLETNDAENKCFNIPSKRLINNTLNHIVDNDFISPRGNSNIRRTYL